MGAAQAQKWIAISETRTASPSAPRVSFDRLAAGVGKAAANTKAPRSQSLEGQSRITAALRPDAGQDHRLVRLAAIFELKAFFARFTLLLPDSKIQKATES